MCQDNICKDMTNSFGILTHSPSYFISGSLAVPFKEATGFSDLCKRFAYSFLLAYFPFQPFQFTTSISGRRFSRNLAGERPKKRNFSIIYVTIRSSFFGKKREDLGTKLVYTLTDHSSRPISVQDFAWLLY